MTLDKTYVAVLDLQEAEALDGPLVPPSYIRILEHSAPHPYPSPHTLHLHQSWNIQRHTLHLTPYTLHLTPYTLHLTHYT